MHLLGIKSDKYWSISFWLELVYKSSREPHRGILVRTMGKSYSLYRTTLQVYIPIDINLSIVICRFLGYILVQLFLLKAVMP